VAREDETQKRHFDQYWLVPNRGNNLHDELRENVWTQGHSGVVEYMCKSWLLPNGRLLDELQRPWQGGGSKGFQISMMLATPL